MSKSAVHLIAHGRVQGVGFRFFVRDHAARLGINGWVKNLPNGSVEVHAEAERELLDEFVARVEKGPTFGRVDDLEIDRIEPTNHYYTFTIEF